MDVIVFSDSMMYRRKALMVPSLNVAIDALDNWW